MEFYKARLLEKISFLEDETNIRMNMRNFTRRKILSDSGITFYGNPKSLDHIYGTERVQEDVVTKIKKNVYPLNSPKRNTSLEEIAVYIQYKPASFLRHFGFVEGVSISLKSTDLETQQTCLFILSKLAQDTVLCQEIINVGGYDLIRQFLVAQDEILRILALAAYEPLTQFDKVKDGMTKRVLPF